MPVNEERNEYDPEDGTIEKARTKGNGPEDGQEPQKGQAPKGENEQEEKEPKAGDEPDQEEPQEKEPGRTPTPREGPPKTARQEMRGEKEAE
jgi:hypothetical protein